jgi:hypothetical protein
MLAGLADSLADMIRLFNILEIHKQTAPNAGCGPVQKGS